MNKTVNDPILYVLRTADFIRRYGELRLQKAKQYDVDQTKIFILFTLTRVTNIIRPTDLSKYAMRTRHTITRALDGLERRGFIRRLSSDTDRRETYVELTAAGKKAAEDLAEDTDAVMSEICAEMSKEQITAMQELLKMVRKRVYHLAQEHKLNF
jgi:DNA-binding MarR family transcriptional regulator